MTWREFLNFPCILHSMPHPTPRNHIRLKHSVGTRLQRAFRKTMLPPCTGRGAEVLLPDRGLLVLGDANLPRPCTVAGPGSPLPSPPQPSHRPSPTHFAPSIRPKTDPALLPTTRSACPSHTLQHHPRTRSRTPDQRSTRRPGIADRVLLITRGLFRRRADGDDPTTLLWHRTRPRAR